MRDYTYVWIERARAWAWLYSQVSRPPNLNPPIFLFTLVGANPPNLMPGKFSGYTYRSLAKIRPLFSLRNEIYAIYAVLFENRPTSQTTQAIQRRQCIRRVVGHLLREIATTCCYFLRRRNSRIVYNAIVTSVERTAAGCPVHLLF